jgi:hypothetical protein
MPEAFIPVRQIRRFQRVSGAGQNTVFIIRNQQVVGSNPIPGFSFSTEYVIKIRHIIKLIEADGWFIMTTKGSHRQ